MIKCPKCGRYMSLKKGNGPHGDYEFYGCNGYPDECKNTVQLEDKYKYDDGKTLEEVVKSQSNNEELSEDEAYDRAFYAAKTDGFSYLDASAFAKNFEKD